MRMVQNRTVAFGCCVNTGSAAPVYSVVCAGQLYIDSAVYCTVYIAPWPVRETGVN